MCSGPLFCSVTAKGNKMSDKTINEVLDFIQDKIDDAHGHKWDEYETLITIKDYIESRRTELTKEELKQMMPKVIIKPIENTGVFYDDSAEEEADNE
jgi:hypothetical protein